MRAKKRDKTAQGDTPDEQALAVRTPDAPNMEVLLATMLAKNDEKFEALRREQSAPTTAGPSSQPDEQPDEGRPAQPLSRHRAARHHLTEWSTYLTLRPWRLKCVPMGRQSGTDQLEHQVIPLLTWVGFS